ncbi:hypothetical protein [Brevibacillus dissolubilis]|nr:hypothetical protein [Brevibacillus dissolubilis]
MLSTWIGDGLLYVVALPFALFQTLEMIEALVTVANDIAEWKKYM